MAYSKDFRIRVLEYILSDNSQVSASKIFKVHISTIRQWLALHKDSDSAGGGYCKNSKRSFRKGDYIQSYTVLVSIRSYTSALSSFNLILQIEKKIYHNFL